jgi:hypothetical protein
VLDFPSCQIEDRGSAAARRGRRQGDGGAHRQLLEPSLLPGALVAADDLDLFPDVLKPYLEYVRDPARGYVSVTIPIGDAMEVSARAR